MACVERGLVPVHLWQSCVSTRKYKSRGARSPIKHGALGLARPTRRAQPLLTSCIRSSGGTWLKYAGHLYPLVCSFMTPRRSLLSHGPLCVACGLLRPEKASELWQERMRRGAVGRKAEHARHESRKRSGRCAIVTPRSWIAHASGTSKHLHCFATLPHTAMSLSLALAIRSTTLAGKRTPLPPVNQVKSRLSGKTFGPTPPQVSWAKRSLGRRASHCGNCRGCRRLATGRSAAQNQ